VQREKMEETEVEKALEKLDGWKFKENKIRKKVEFANFAEALAFVNQVGEIAERLDHHPDIKFGWGYAKIKTTTHDRDGVTDFDIELARQIDEISANSG
jgi:4a-hydroxytetrahydrobiopterin dehydratase